jgi:WD40 repeat protein
MKKSVLITLFLANSALAQNQCENIFADVSGKQIVQELAGLKLDAEKATSNNPVLANMLQDSYKRKYVAAQKSGIDLSSLPQAIEAARQGQEIKTTEEKNRRQAIKLKEENLAPWKKTRTIDHSEYSMYSLLPHPQKDEILFSNAVQVFRMDLTSGNILEIFKGTSAQWNPDGRLVITRDGRKKNSPIMIIDTQTKNTYGPFKFVSSGEAKYNMSPDGKKLIAFSRNSAIFIWDASSGVIVRKHLGDMAGPFNSVVMSPDGHHLLIDRGGTVFLWDIDKGEEVRTYREENDWDMKSAIFNPDGSKVLTTNVSEMIMYETSTGKTLWKAKRPKDAGFNELSFSPDGTRILSVDEYQSDLPVNLWDARTGSLLQRFPAGPNEYPLGFFNFDGTKIITGNHQDPLQVWEQIHE